MAGILEAQMFLVGRGTSFPWASTRELRRYLFTARTLRERGKMERALREYRAFAEWAYGFLTPGV